MNECKREDLNVFEKESYVKDELTGSIKSSLSGFLRVCLVGLLVLFQFVLIIILPFLLRNYATYFYAVLELFSIIVMLSLVNDNRSPSFKIAWICIVLVLPISGHIMYILWGQSGSKKQIEKKYLERLRHSKKFISHDRELEEQYARLNPMSGRMSKYLAAEGFPLFKNNKVEYYSMGELVFEAIFTDLEKAEKFIFMHFFIVAEGAIWDKLHEILLRKIKQGVEVKFLYDDFGATLRTNKNFRRDLEAEGFEIRVFNPIHKYTDKLYMNYRTHQKVVVIDGNVGFTGGFNIADEYANTINRFGVWKDNGVRVVGDAVWGFTQIFLEMWEMCSTSEYLDFYKYKPSKTFELNDVYCHVISDGPINNPNNPIENTYRQIIQCARNYLYITTPYLIIEDDMKDTLITAAKSGVDVRIITPSIPDKKRVYYLTNYNYGFLLKNGVKIYEYTPGFIHAKTIINEQCGFVGTVNMDYRSFYLHYECGVWMSDYGVIQTIKNDLVKTMQQSREITYEEWKNRALKLKLIQPVLNLFSTLM